MRVKVVYQYLYLRKTKTQSIAGRKDIEIVFVAPFIFEIELGSYSRTRTIADLELLEDFRISPSGFKNFQTGKNRVHRLEEMTLKKTWFSVFTYNFWRFNKERIFCRSRLHLSSFAEMSVKKSQSLPELIGEQHFLKSFT